MNRQAESEAKKDTISMSERGGLIFPILGGFIVIAFFALHQVWATGFFTQGFGSIEAFLLFAPLILFELTFVARMAIGRKNVVRPFDAATLIFVALATVWLYVVFPFNFPHLPDVLPNFVRFAISWITAEIARAVMIIQILGAGFFGAYTALLYLNVRRILKTQK